jgi:IS5 family transposase
MVKKLKTYLGRVVREIERQELDWRTDPLSSLLIVEELTKAKRLLAQEKTSKHKLYSLHAPEVECISKGKAHKRYEFGVKASIAVTNRSNFVVGGLSLPGNPYDGHTLNTALDQVRRITGHGIKEAYVDKGYRGNDEEEATVYLSGQKRGVKTRSLRKRIRRREAIEPIIGHLKNDGHLGRNYLHGSEGDEMNIVLACAGHNLHMILRRLKIFCGQILWTIHRILVRGRQFIARPCHTQVQVWP